ncbi:hypothetical protein B0H13DRAFT_1860261 [Mycena leptocephala]|nr:hypothetical protein B0H13DRAFT_1860261 [Mycena leptocephala]
MYQQCGSLKIRFTGVMRHFPQELIDIVLDQVAEQDCNGRIWRIRRPPTPIATCGLVCKQWLPRSRLHVFRTVVLYGPRLRNLLDLQTESSLPLLSLAQDLFLIFGDFTPDDVASLRACLRLTHPEIGLPTSGDEIRNSFLRTHLPFLETHCSSLSSLKLSPCEKSAVPLGIIVDILGCLPSVTSLELEGQSCRIVEPQVLPLQPCPRRLETLNIAVKDGADALFAWFLSLALAPRIKSLTLLEEWEDDPTPHSLVAYCQSGLWTTAGPINSIGLEQSLAFLLPSRQFGSPPIESPKHGSRQSANPDWPSKF